MNRRELQQLSLIRIQEAKQLLRLDLPSGAYYLGGYAVECALKAVIAKQTKKYDFPDRRKVDSSHTHNLRELAKIADLESFRLEQSRADPAFGFNWDVVEAWSEQSRYRTHPKEEAFELIDAVGNAKHGVLRWIRQRW